MRLADWTILITDVPTKRLRFEEALVLLRERWQMELLYKLWKSEGLIDEWRTANPWRVVCELYAKLIGMLLQHWLIVLFAWHDPQRSLVKLAQVARDSSWVLMDAAFRASQRAAGLATDWATHALGLPDEQAQNPAQLGATARTASRRVGAELVRPPRPAGSRR